MECNEDGRNVSSQVEGRVFKRRKSDTEEIDVGEAGGSNSRDNGVTKKGVNELIYWKVKPEMG